ncbi:unnamed protein product [Calypogeia fissa]
MNRMHETSSSSSPSPSVSSTDNGSTASDTFSFMPEGGHQPNLHGEDSAPTFQIQGPIQGPGKLVPRRSPDGDSKGEYLELEHRNGGSPLPLKNRDSPRANGQEDVDNGEKHSRTGDGEAGHAVTHIDPQLESTSDARLSTTRSAPVLPHVNTFPVDPNVTAKTGRSEVDDVARGSEREGFSVDIPGPKRKLLATVSAPVRISSAPTTPQAGAGGDSKIPHHNHGEPHEDASECTTPQSSKSEDMQSLSDQTGGATCGSGASPSLVRTKSMPSRSFSEVEEMNEMRRSNTQSGQRRMKSRNKEDLNVRLVAPEKMSERKKKKLMRHLATIKKDGTVEFDVAGSARIASNLFGPGIFDEGGTVGEEAMVEDDDEQERRDVPPLQIVMLIVGTRGDVQPFVAIGKHLQEYGHRVRLATHTNFREFVMTAGLEFYPLGGDPKVLAGYMVKNKGFLPSGPGEIQVQRKQIKAIINSLLPACVETDTESGNAFPFRAQAIIANPPAYGHVHVAEYLQVPLHIFFTMPWTATSQFPHPLSRVKSSAGYRMSYQVVDSLIWWGIRSMINDFRKKKLKLRPITYLSGTQGSISELPTGYIWSPHLVPKPRDWGPLVDVVGFCFLDLAQDYKPPKDLMQWLKAGPPPIYVGFGSLPVVDPKGMTEIIVKALEVTEQRGIIYKGWGGMGDLAIVPENIFLIEDCPHDWLFKQCKAVVHHGGAGTTAAGLKAACPTTVVPFFGDQPFWGEQINKKGVGPPPIAVDQFSLDKLVKAIQYMLQDEVKQKAEELAKAMENEDGIEGAVQAFHKHLPRDTPQPPHTHPPDKLRFKVFKPLRNVYSCFT